MASKAIGIMLTLLSIGMLTMAFDDQPVGVEAQPQIVERLPRVFVVTSTVEPQGVRAEDLWTDLFEYGIVANVSSTSTYNSMNRSDYDIIIFSGYSNPVDPEDMYLNMVADVDAGRKLIFMNHIPFKQTYRDGTTLKTFYKLSVVDMPQDFPSGRFDTSELSLVCNPGDSYLEEAEPSLTSARYFSALPETAIGWVKDEISGHYFAIFTTKGGWIGENRCNALHMGKVVAKLWWGETNRGFGFSMNVMYGAPVFLWRVDADRSKEEAPLRWLSDLATLYNLKISAGARGGTITSDAIAGYWCDLATNPLVEIGVHTYTHKSPISAQNITHEVIDTYELLLSYNIPAEKFFLGWGTSDWSWQQIKTLFDRGWTVIQSSREDRFVPDRYNIDTIANFTVAPPLLGLTGRCDWNAYNGNFNFTKVNIELYRKRQQAHLPFLLLTHDYIYHRDSYYNDYGPLKDQIEAFFDWLRSQEVYSVWITEYYDFFQDTFTAMITKSNNVFSVTRPKAKANFVKVFVGTNQTYAVGTSVLKQKILDGWLYITLAPETMSTFTLSDTRAPIVAVLSPQNATYSASSVPLTLALDEPASWIGYSLDGKANITIVGNTTLTGLSDAMHNLVVYASDIAGNIGSSDMVFFTIDTTPPSISIMSPENRTYGTADIPLAFTVDESVSWMAYCLNGHANVTITGNTTLAGLLDGVHYVVVYANDTAGNMGVSDTVCFTVDTTPPNITDVSQIPLEDNVLPEDEVRINAIVTDELSGVKQVSLNYTNGNGTWINVNMTNLGGNVWNATIPAFPYGTNVTYTVTAQDNAGNIITTEDLGYEYQYTVIPEFPSLIHLPLFMIVTLLGVVVLRLLNISSQRLH